MKEKIFKLKDERNWISFDKPKAYLATCYNCKKTFIGYKSDNECKECFILKTKSIIPFNFLYKIELVSVLNNDNSIDRSKILTSKDYGKTWTLFDENDLINNKNVFIIIK